MKILYFAWVRERIGKDSEDICLPTDIRTVAKLADWLCTKHDGYKAALENHRNLKVAVNQTLVDWDYPLEENDEIAFFPPMTGG